MNLRTRLLVIAALIALGVVALAVALTQCEGHPAPATDTPPPTPPGTTEAAVAIPITPRATVLPVVSPETTYTATTVFATPSRTPRPTPIVVEQTGIPLSYFSATVNITATATELKVGNVVTVTFQLTNVGKSTFRYPACSLIFYEEEEEVWDLSLVPLTLVEERPELPWCWWGLGNDLPTGQSFQGECALRAIRPVTVSLEVHCSGKVDAVVGSTAGTTIGVRSNPLVVHIH